MLRKYKPVVFDPYGKRRSRWHVPAWLWLLLAGGAAGAGGVLYVQERHLPPRLSVEASAKLQSDFEQADGERTRLKSELANATKQLQAAVTEKKRLAEDATAQRRAADDARGDLATLIDTLPPDPRGGSVHVRAARFTADEGKLFYDVVLFREAAGGKPMSGVVQFVVAGVASGKRGPEATVKLQPVAVSIGRFEVLRGSLSLPEGFDPRQATVNVLDHPDGKLLGMRIMNVGGQAPTKAQRLSKAL